MRARICSTVAREREGRSGSFMEDLTQDVRYVRKSGPSMQQQTIIMVE
ncbi:hypothetical protein ALQ43_102457 [Pseudomonas savastanoi pv. glycinea]|uniref:Uncharacterized protein n=4 Tax=Pseudomonas syringae group genomosp. 2 TaxID=251698 RepID=A0A3M2WIX9_PSEA0|nr:hypothetical protein ALO55_102408 [Pseudomonas savastanoi pv. phaseolicola]RML51470.1 hypothetical protein ALQ94_101903 [Pseudomonas amygdali pv. morsprunorum]RMO31679.1 hypothetical protein ALQ43_102457 [Pseudomonas savastanoi pv. glycinea]RMP69184.1 hypothetical protein ALQ19_101996 [Pseudomonas syringae pv. berberidis]RMR25197.1 hypothetical protein ALP90_102037 [Pseudomonas amygdali pv. ulmi]